MRVNTVFLKDVSFFCFKVTETRMMSHIAPLMACAVPIINILHLQAYITAN